MRFSRSILIAAVTLVTPFISNSTPVTSNPMLSLGGLTFNNFSCNLIQGGPDAAPSGCGQIDVATITQPGRGIEFSSGFAAFPSFDDAVLGYSVTSTSGIATVGLDFNGTFYGHAVSSVTESVYSGSTLVGFAQVACGPDSIGCTRSDSIKLNGAYNNLYIKKDVSVASSLGLAQISYIDQTFSETPEPSSLLLLGTGLLGAAGLLRRRAKSLKGSSKT